MFQEIKTQDNRSTSEPIFNVGYYLDQTWVTVMPFFTNRGALEFIENEKYNYEPKLKIYVSSGHNNPEWIRARKILSDENF